MYWAIIYFDDADGCSERCRWNIFRNISLMAIIDIYLPTFFVLDIIDYFLVRLFSITRVMSWCNMCYAISFHGRLCRCEENIISLLRAVSRLSFHVDFSDFLSMQYANITQRFLCVVYYRLLIRGRRKMMPPADDVRRWCDYLIIIVIFRWWWGCTSRCRMCDYRVIFCRLICILFD